MHATITPLLKVPQKAGGLLHSGTCLSLLASNIAVYHVNLRCLCTAA
jgi:hypothetical protein